MLKVKNLTKHFGGVAAVSNCSFRVEPNTITALIGPNGAGKTTVFNLLSGLLSQDSGEIIVGNEAIGNRPAFARAQGLFSRTFQLNQVFLNMTVEENCLLAFDLHDQDFWKNMVGIEKDEQQEKQKVQETLELLGIASQAHTLASLCSYGQQKLVGIARALLLPHTMLLLDEPVAGVNPKLREDLKGILRELKTKGETILVIEHDMEFVMNVADHVIVMSEGRVLKAGSPKEIQKDKGVLEIYLGKS